MSLSRAQFKGPPDGLLFNIFKAPLSPRFKRGVHTAGSVVPTVVRTTGIPRPRSRSAPADPELAVERGRTRIVAEFEVS